MQVLLSLFVASSSSFSSGVKVLVGVVFHYFFLVFSFNIQGNNISVNFRWYKKVKDFFKMNCYNHNNIEINLLIGNCATTDADAFITLHSILGLIRRRETAVII